MVKILECVKHKTKKKLEMNHKYLLCLAYFLKDSRIIRVVIVSKVNHSFVGAMLTDPGECGPPSQSEEMELRKKEGMKGFCL